MLKGLGILAGLGTAYACAGAGAAWYFVNRTIVRKNAAEERTIKMAGTQWEPYFPEMKKKREHLMEQEHRECWIQSDDGLKLHGTYFPAKDSKKTVICFHGYTSKGMNDYGSIAGFYLAQGFHVLIVDERAHGLSEGNYIGFGCLDRWDARKWIYYVNEHLVPGGELLLHGISMGGATVLMASGLKLPYNVKGIISDCAFTSPWKVFESVLKTMYHMPAFPVLHIADQLAVQRAGYSLKQCDAGIAVTKTKIPVLLIHGSADSFVPCRMCHEIYGKCSAPKELLIVEGAGHAESYYKDTEVYEAKVKAFLKERAKLICQK